MKKIFNLSIILLLLTFVVSSCIDKTLDKLPLDSNSDDGNWTTESALETYSWNLYGDLNDYSYGNGWTKGQYHNESICDDYAAETFTQFTTNVPDASGSWNSPYDMIRKANILLERVDRVPNLSEAAANHWKGIARFFRALHHFRLVRTYGDVVWVEKDLNITNEEDISRPRDSRVLVMDNVVADLEFAMNNCYAPQRAGVNVINNMVAAALLSRAALYEAAWEKYHNVSGGHPEQFYTKAKEAAKKVIDSGIYSLTDDYKGNYTSISLAENPEMLLYMIYSWSNVNKGKVSKGHSIAGWSNSSTPTWGLTKSAVENFARADGLPIHMSPAAYDDQTPQGIFSNRDKRLAGIICDTLLPIQNLPSLEGINSNTGYWTWKFVSLDKYDEMIKNATWNAPANDTDGPIFAYPEVLLNYAEACAELGSITQTDLDISVNLLREKHGGIPPLTLVGTTGCSVNGTTITQAPNDPAPNVLLQEIRRERRSELMCDGFRYDDLMRWKLGENLDFSLNPDGFIGVSLEALKAIHGSNWNDQIENDKFWINGYLSPYNTAVVNREWDDKHYLQPIPSGQITLDPNLGQNPGW